MLDYIKTYVERDLRQILNVSDLGRFQQFLEICAGRIGQLVNFSDIGGLIGVSYQTVNKWLSVLETSFITYTLRPYHQNFNKRIVKTPNRTADAAVLLRYGPGLRLARFAND